MTNEFTKNWRWNGKVVLITGIGGQDGSYLAELLLLKGYKVRGIVRRASWPNTKRIDHLDVFDPKYGKKDESPFFLLYADLADSVSIRTVLERIRPNEIYNLAAQSHVGISFDNPESTFNYNALGPLRILEAIRDMKLDCKYYQASSSEMFGVSPPPQNENTLMLPQSPYGISKVAAYHITRMYRNAYGIFACNGILFNHECISENAPIMVRKKDSKIISIRRIKDIRKPRSKGGNIQQWILNDLEIWDGEDFVSLNCITASKRKKEDENFHCKTINTRHGIIEITNHHNMLDENKNKLKSKDVQIGTRLLHKEFPEQKEISILSKEEALFLGMMIGDGYVSEDGKGQFTNNNQEVRELLIKIWTKIALGSVTIRSFKTEYGKATQTKLNGNSNYLKLIRKEIYTNDGFKKIPDRILNANKEIKLAFLSGYNITDGLKSNPCVYEFKNFKTNSILLAQGLLFLIKQTTKQDYNISFEKKEGRYGYYSVNLLSPNNSLEKQKRIENLIINDLSQREIYRQTGISRTFIRKVQDGEQIQIQHHLSKQKSEVKNFFYHGQQPEWVFDIETGSGELMAGVGTTVIANSPRRGLNFVTRKITFGIAKIIVGEDKKLVLGNLNAMRDWGFAKEYVEAMWKIMQLDKPQDIVISTRETHTVKEFVEEAFGLLDLDWREFVETSESYKRPAEVPALLGDSTKAEKLINWKPKTKFKELVKMMLAEDLKEKMFEQGYLGYEDRNKDHDYYLEKAKELVKNSIYDKENIRNIEKDEKIDNLIELNNSEKDINYYYS